MNNSYRFSSCSDNEQKGFTFIETLVGVAVFVIIAVALMQGLYSGYTSLGISQESVYAESLAQSQMEYIKTQNYISITNYDPEVEENRYTLIDVPEDLVDMGYSVEIEPPILIDVPGVSGYELQGVTINVNYQGEIKLSITFYRTGLSL